MTLIMEREKKYMLDVDNRKASPLENGYEIQKQICIEGWQELNSITEYAPQCRALYPIVQPKNLNLYMYYHYSW